MMSKIFNRRLLALRSVEGGGQRGTEHPGPESLKGPALLSNRTRDGFGIYTCSEYFPSVWRSKLASVLFDLQKKRRSHRMLIATSVDVLPCGADNFSLDPSLGRVSDYPLPC